MSTEDLKQQLRRNLIRLWTHMGVPADADRQEVETRILQEALESLFTQCTAPEPGLFIADGSPKSKLVTKAFPVGLPGLDLYRELREGTVPPDHRDLASKLIIGSSPVILQAVEIALRLAPTTVPVLISGETGTGKELFARLIHKASAVASGPLITVNCAAVPDTLLMAELFGYEPGAFTGAAPRGRLGKIEAADGGTLLLDEIGDLAPAGQAAFLRFLDSGEVQKIGRAQSRKVTVRLICSTNCNLEEMVESGDFRKDLYFRIALVPLFVPPLRERSEDIPALVAHVLADFRRRHRRSSPTGLTGEARDRLTTHQWPGNVRELIFTLERAFLLCNDESIDVVDLPADVPKSVRTETHALLTWIHSRLREARPSLFRDRDRWVRFLIEHRDNPVTTGQVVREFDISEASARIRLSTLVTLGVLSAIGHKKGRKYYLLAPSE
ncbi:sigma 54-interacting transcriptional regulator [bacterium]|nr:sigma 54-interacting transcriptional regulator [bacterium]MBU1985562.1 sigma 54-interacting transcriptional regulator [bacterium]